MTPYLEIDMQVTAEHDALRQAVHEFARHVLRPAAIELDRLGDPLQVIARDSQLWSALQAAYARGFHTALIPVAAGGMGLSGIRLHIALEELGWGSADFAIALAVTSFPFAAAAEAGDPALVDEFLVPFVADRSARYVGCWAITEPDHGSDHFLHSGSQFRDPALHGSVTARRDGDTYVIRGQKSRWVSNGSIATHALVHVCLDAGMGMAGGGLAIVPLDLPGVARGGPLDKMGQRALNQGALRFDDVRIPIRYMLLADPTAYASALDETLSMTGAAMGAIFTGVRARRNESRPVARGARLQPIRRAGRERVLDSRKDVLHASCLRGR